MGNLVSRNSYDFSNLTLVPVISSFNSTGEIAPLYVRINGTSYKILSYYRIDNFGFPVFKCKINNFGTTRDITLTYHPSDFVWSLKS